MVILQVCLLPLLARRMGLGFYSGAGASVLWLVAHVPSEVVWEQSCSGVCVTGMAFLMFAALEEEFSFLRAAVCGALWGGLLLLSPVALLPLALWVVLLAITRAQKAANLAVLLLVAVAVLTPWMVRNYQTFHKFVFARDNLGLELEVSNNPCADFSFEINRITGCYPEHHPNESLAEAEKVAQVGEVRYNQQRMQIAVQWIRSEPAAFARLTMERTAAFWLPSLLHGKLKVIQDRELYSPLRDAIVTLSSILVPPGLILLWKRNRSTCLVLLTWLLAFPPVYYLTQYNERARIPVEWAILLPACFALGEFWLKLRGPKSAG